MMNLFGSKKTVPEAYNSTMPMATPPNKIVVSFDALGEKYNGKYKITAEKGGKTAEYVVDPNAPSVNKAVVEAIVSKLNGGEEKVPEPTGPTAPTAPTGPQETIEKLLKEIQTAVETTPVDTSAIKTAADAIKTAADEIKEAADEIKEAADAIIKAVDEIKEEHDKGEAKEDDTTAVEKIKTAVENINTAVANIRALIVPTVTTGGYNSAKSAVPKRITRMRRTRRSTKLAGTRRRRRLTR